MHFCVIDVMLVKFVSDNLLFSIHAFCAIDVMLVTSASLICQSTKCAMQGAIQVLRNAVGGGWVSAFLEKIVTEVYGSTLLALQGGGWRSNSQEKHVT